MNVADRLKLVLAAFMAFSAASCSTFNGEGASLNDEPLAAEENEKRVFILQADLAELEQQALNSSLNAEDLLRSSLDVVQGRIEGLGAGTMEVNDQGNGRILVTSSELDSRDLVESAFGIPTPLHLKLVDDTASPADLEAGNLPVGRQVFFRTDGTKIVVRRLGGVSGKHIVGALTSIDPWTDQYVVTLELDEVGTQKLEQMTRDNVGMPVAIILDGEVISTPIIMEPITGGGMQISSNFNQESANELAVRLRSGALPADFEILEEKVGD